MKRFFALAVAVCFVFTFAGLASAVGTGKKLEYEEKTKGTVVFDGKTHADAGLKCAGCHSQPKIFAMKKGSLTMAEMKAGKSCGTCHNGQKAFDVAECAKCHKK
jgi:c(7)-type cytochrome triheme protein